MRKLALLAAAILSLALVNPVTATKPPWAGTPGGPPKASPTPAPTITPTVKPWSIVFITYRSIDATCNGLAVKTTLSDAEYAEALQLEHDAVANINAWNPGIALTPTYVTRGTLTTLTSLGGNACWVGPENVPSRGAFDSAYVLFDPRNGTGDYYFGYGGYSKTCGSCTAGFAGGYSTSIALPQSYDYRLDTIYNEWLHPTAAWYREHNAYVSPPENTGPYGYPTHHDFLRALISGTLPDLNGDGHSDGITSWQQQMAGTPTS